MKSIKPSISVVIPAFNEEEYLPACLRSLQKQTFKDFEVIVVDNNSTDNTAEIARSFGARVVVEKVQGMTPARERGYKEAKADIIARTDADTIVLPDWLATVYKAFMSNPQAAAVTGNLLFTEVFGLKRGFLDIYMKYGFYGLTRLLMGHLPLIGPNHAVRKSVWTRTLISFNDKHVHEDMDLSCYLADFGEIIYCPEMEVKFSLRRWRKSFFPTLHDYNRRYFKSILIHHPGLSRKHRHPKY